MSVNVAIEALTLDEIETVENLTQRSIETIMNDGVPKGRTLKAILFVLQSRTNPNTSMESVGKMSLTETMKYLETLTDPKG